MSSGEDEISVFTAGASSLLLNSSKKDLPPARAVLPPGLMFTGMSRSRSMSSTTSDKLRYVHNYVWNTLVQIERLSLRSLSLVMLLPLLPCSTFINIG